jgi:hypothetical protein
MLFGDTWDWDGKHWTKRQDIGPSARWLHTMALDVARGHLVVFGGLAGDSTTKVAPANVLNDTWEHSDAGGSAAGGPAPGANGVALAKMDGSLQNRDPLFGSYFVEVTLTGPAPAPGVDVTLDLSYARPNVSLRPVAVPGQPQPPLAGPPWKLTVPAGNVDASASLYGAFVGLGLTLTAEAGGVSKTLALP